MRKLFLALIAFIALIFIALIIFIAVIVIAIIVIALMAFAPTNSSIYDIAEEAPPDSDLIIYANMEELAANNYVKNKTGTPDIGPLRMLLDYGGMIQQSENKEMIIVIKSFALDLIASNAPTITSTAKNFVDLPEIKPLNYNGETIYRFDAGAYKVHNGKVVLGETETIKKTIRTKKTAVDTLEPTLSKMKEEELMIVMRTGNETIGISAEIKEEIADTNIIIQTQSEQHAQMYKQLINTFPIDGLEVKSAWTEGKFFHAKANVELEKIENMPTDFLSQTMVKSLNETNNTINPITPPVRPNTTQIPSDIPCETEEECRIYCMQHPEECDELLQKYSKDSCCAECISAYVKAGHGLGSIGMKCESFELSDECSQRFIETQETIMDCYEE